MSPHCEVAVIGAGMAGLSAARALAEAGSRVVLLEARERVGGRIFSARSPDGTLVELGAEFVHGKPEPTLDLARDAGAILSPVSERHFAKHGPSFRESLDPWEPLRLVLQRSKHGEPDSSAQAFLERQGIAPETGERFRQLVEGFEAAPIAEVSIQSLAEDSETLSKDDSQFRIDGGYGQLVDYACQRALAAGVELRLSTAVAGVTWAERGPVSLQFEADRPRLEARRCVVAVPLGVLQASPENQGIACHPPLAAWQPALAQLAMGHACRIVFSFGGSLALKGVPPDAFIHNSTSLFETFWAQYSPGSCLWTAWAGGPKASELAKESAEQRQRLALGALATLFDLPEARLRYMLRSVHQHDFSNDPRVRGAYSFCKPGGAKASEALSSPLGGALFLAGEATDHRYPGTVAGAIASGQRAAKQVLESLAR